MGLYDDQIKQRQKNDQTAFSESMRHMAISVLGRDVGGEEFSEHVVTRDALNGILRYYGQRPAELPETVTDMEERLDLATRPGGIAWRKVRLSEGWQRKAAGPMLAWMKKDGLPTALIPKPFGGYYVETPGKGRETVRRNMARKLQEEAIVFYRPLPKRRLKVRDLFSYIRSCLGAGDVGLFVVLTLVITLVGMLIPLTTRLLTGFTLDHENKGLFFGSAGFLLGVFVSMELLMLVWRIAVNRLKTKTSLSLEAAMMQRVLSLPASFFRNYSSGELTSRITAANRLCTLLVMSLFSTGLICLTSLLYLVQIYSLARSLFGPAVLLLLLSTGVTVVEFLMLGTVKRKQMEAGAKENGLSYALLTGMHKLRLSGAEKRAFTKWAERGAETMEYTYRPPVFLSLHTAIQTGIFLFGTILIYFLAVRSQVTPSDYLAFSAACGLMLGAFLRFFDSAGSFAELRSILELTRPILAAEPETSGVREVVQELSGAIELSNVSFRYHERMPYIVDGMSLKVRPGEYVAIVGKTGCGKSTLLRLLLGFEIPERGAIYYDGRDMTKLEPRTLRRRIGTVTQDGSLFYGTILENITIAAPHVSEEQAWSAAEIAGIAEDIRQMPMGMHTIISEGQGGISGGQKQRLMIARAIAHQPDIIMLDEATSALDNRTQRKVSDALDALNCTRIVIAHRLSTIRHCDRILVLDRGRIREEGTYEELIAKNGVFAELVSRQKIN
ncbi:MAG: ATP-binding cassette domain-containing protein [Lachnospiraceae bacterium]|nr:ATP-binding cassette domain-containing protein [Lachnospiraceae bacterium]